MFSSKVRVISQEKSYANRGVQYVLSMMHKYIMVKVGKSQKTKKGEFINVAEIGGICINGF